VGQRRHGGADERGPARFDFSTCANAAGPCPAALAAVHAADATRYPDPASTAVRLALAHLHGVEPWRVLPAASASEFIQRITSVTGRLWPGAVRAPRLAYSDYAAAAAACGRALCAAPVGEARVDAPGVATAAHAIGRLGPGDTTLDWHADPTSPLGQDGTGCLAGLGRRPAVLDAVYAPLRLQGASAWSAAARDAVFVLHSPNKALGLTGVRGAYAIAPCRADYDVHACCAALEAAAPSWPLSAHAVALLRCWATPGAQSWVERCLGTLSAWKADLQRRLAARGFVLLPSVTPYFVVRPPVPIDPNRLRAHDVAVRETTSFGLPDHWRISAQPPSAQDALMRALDAVERDPAPRRAGYA
jgi:histidinol-phosphate aminotransferase